MSKYIDADKLKEFYKPYAERKLSVPVDVILLNIDDMPTEDVQEVRHGRWNELPYSYECSVCGIIRPKEMTGKWHYCPNCGALMVAEDE